MGYRVEEEEGVAEARGAAAEERGAAGERVAVEVSSCCGAPPAPR